MTYEPRMFRALPFWRIGPLTVKPTTIALNGIVLAEGSIDAARAKAERVLPAAAESEGGAAGQGFVVLHQGMVGTWLLMDWWAHGDILCQRLAYAQPGDTSFVDVSDRPLTACVWELRVLDHEARAFTRHILSDPADPDAWACDRLPDGLH